MGAFIDNEVGGDSEFRKPYSHAAGYEACDRTDLMSCSDLRVDAMEQVGKRYGVSKEKQYTDYKELIDNEQPDIVSVATQPEHRAEIIIYAAEHGVKGIYAEKALAASMDEAKAILEAVERNGVAFNMGTNRRWETGYDKMKDFIAAGEIGDLESIILYGNGTLFNTSSHTFDLMLKLNGDQPVSWVQANLPDGDAIFDGDILTDDPNGEGLIKFTNGVTAYALLSNQVGEFEAVGTRGRLKAVLDGREWEFRLPDSDDERGRALTMRRSFPEVLQKSSTLRLVEDIVHSLDSGEPTKGGVRVAYANTELIFAFIESHRRGGAKVKLPLDDSTARLKRDRAPRQPRYAPRTD